METLKKLNSQIKNHANEISDILDKAEGRLKYTTAKDVRKIAQKIKLVAQDFRVSATEEWKDASKK